MIIKFLKKKFNSIKICAVFTAVCFMVSTLGANLYAIPMTENANQKYEDVFAKASSISNEYGKITSSKDAGSDVTVINIQDLHCHPQTQRNIAKIIGQISDKYNLKKVYVEGGYGDIDVSWLNSIKDEDIRKKLIEELLEEGILTGSEYYKLTSNNDNVELKGIDEKELHQDNVKRLSWIIDNQDKYKELSKKINKEISFLEQRYVNIRNKRFYSNIEDYFSGKIDTKRFYRQLLKYVKDINSNPDDYNNITAIRLEDYPNISKFMTLRKVSKNINVRDVTQQLQIVINELKNRLPYNVYTRLLKETENFSDSQKVVELITLLCNKEGIDLENKYRSLSEFLKSNEINRELNTVELVYEERDLITEIRKALSYNNEEYEITFISDFSRYFQDYLEYKLTDADWKYFERGYEQFRQLYAKYATVDRIKEIENDIAELNKYYEINDIRNEIFVNNLLQDEQPAVLDQTKLRQDEEILKQSKEVIIAVTGGFHSQELEDILQAKEVNTIIITPSIFEGIEKATKQYKGIIKEQSKEFQHQALAYRILSNLENSEQKVVMYGVLKRILGNNVKQLQDVLGKDVDLDALEKELQNLKSLSEQDQIIVDKTVKYLDAAVDIMMDLLPKEGGKIIFAPNVNEIILKVSKGLVDAGIFLSDGPIFSVEQQGLPDLQNVSAEYYSRMHYEIQKALNGGSNAAVTTRLSIAPDNQLLDATAPLWEELYRVVPTVLTIGLQQALIVFLGLNPIVSSIIVALVGLYIFSLCQKQFVASHIIRMWLNTEYSGDQIKTWKKLQKSLYERLKLYTFNLFPNKELFDDFDFFYKNNDAAVAKSKGLLIPTVTISLPYLIVLGSMIVTFTIPSAQLIIIATVAGSLIHFINNVIIAPMFEERPIFKEEKRETDFRHIMGRMQYVRLLLEYSNRLPKNPAGPEQKYVQQFTNIIGKLQDKLRNAMSEQGKIAAQLQEVESQIKAIEDKKRKSKKDREQLRQLEQQRLKLEKINKQYPKIMQELALTDKSKFVETVKSINKLAPVFNEVDNIIALIEEYKKTYKGSKQANALENEFVRFTSTVLTRELMQKYDEKVTGDHVRRVLYLSLILGLYMNVDGDIRFKYKLMLSALFHDIGKNLIPNAILNSQDTLDDIERDIMEFHAVFGALILKSSSLQNLAYHAGNHHYTKGYGYENKLDQISEQPFDLEDEEIENLNEADRKKLIEERQKILEIIALSDVYEAVSPKLSIEAERNYQLSAKIQSIKNIFENAIDYWGSNEREKIIELIDEINTIEEETNEVVRQTKERSFIEKVLYKPTRDSVLKYIREKNDEMIRNRAFEIIFTRSPKFLFDHFNYTEKEFSDELFSPDNETIRDDCLALADESIQYNTDVLKAFLRLFFTSKDIEINKIIIDEMGYSRKENVVWAHIKRFFLNIDRITKNVERRIGRRISLYLPVRASIFGDIESEESSADTIETDEASNSFALRDLGGQDVVVEKTIVRENIKEPIIDVRRLFIEKSGTIRTVIDGWKQFLMSGERSSYGIEKVDTDSEGNVIRIQFSKAVKVITKMFGQPKGDVKNNLSFGELVSMLKKGTTVSAEDDKANKETDKKIIDVLKKDTGAKDVVKIYLDDDDVLSNIAAAIKNGQLMIIYPFRDTVKTKDLSPGQIYERYIRLYDLLERSKFKYDRDNEHVSVFPAMEQLEKEIEADRQTDTLDFFLKELLKNNFGHGNKGLFECPMACYVSKDGSELYTYNLSLDSVADKDNYKTLAKFIYDGKYSLLERYMHDSVIFGDHAGRNYMKGSKLRDFEDGPLAIKDFPFYKENETDSELQFGDIADVRFYRAKVTLKPEYTERLKELTETAKQEEREQTTVTDTTEVSEGMGQEASILKPFGVKAADYAPVWEEIVFRYLPTVAILLNLANPILGMAIAVISQILFIIAHPISKWIAEKRDGKNVSLWELIKKDVKNLSLPTLVMMLPYAGSILALAVAPALEIIISPALFMFADVIVKWLTNKDSGGKISISKGFVISTVISSLLAFSITAAFPVISPFINPIVIVNTVRAGILHYRYNKGQQDQDKLLSVKNKNRGKKQKGQQEESTAQEEPVIKREVREMIQRLADKYNIDLSTNKILTDLLYQTRTPSQTLLCYMGQTNLDTLFKLLSKISVTDPYYDIKCQIIVRSCAIVEFNFNLEEKEEEIDWVVNQENRALLIFALHTPLLITDETTFGLFSLYTTDQLEELFNKFNDNLEDLEELLKLNSTGNVEVFFAILDMSNITKYLDSENFKDLVKLYSMYGVLPLQRTMERLDVTAKNDEERDRKKAKELENYIKLIKENSDVVVNKKIPIAKLIEKTNSVAELASYINVLKENSVGVNISKDLLNNIIGKTNSADELREYMDVINKNSDVIVNILNIDEKILTEIITKTNSADELKKYFNLVERYKFVFDTTTRRKYEYEHEVIETVPADYRWKIALEYLNIEENIEGEIFKYLLTRRDPNGDKYDLFKDFPKDSNFFREIFYGPSENKTKYINLFNSLIKRQFKGIASENDFLALRLLFDDGFNEKLTKSGITNISNPNNIVARYYAAIAVSRFIYDTVEGEIKDYSRSEIKSLIENVTDLYISLLKATGGKVIMDKKTQIYVLCNDEKNEYGGDRFNTDSIERMAQLVGVESPIIKYLRKNDSRTNKAKNNWLGKIEDLDLGSDPDAKAYFLFNGHGGKNGLYVKNDGEHISPEELADRLFKLATRPENPVDLRRVTIDLSCCNSYFFAKNVYNLLEEKYRKEGIGGTYPTIITEAGLETELGYGVNGLGNLHAGILGVLKEGDTLTLDMLALSEYQFSLSNITMFTSFDKKLSGEIAELREKIIKAFDKDKEQQGVVSVREKVEDRKKSENAQNLPGVVGIRENVEAGKNGVDTQDLHKDEEQVVELSIIPGLRKYAPVWEEIVFRYLPTVAILLNLANPILGMAIAVISQVLFIIAHPISKWITAKRNNEQVNIKELIKEDVKNLSLPTLVMMLPYAGSILALAVAPALEILVSPALFMFADVIVKWLTRKDSGGKISISKKFIASTLVSSVLAFSITVAFPVISPFINPIVITNTIRAGILHYRYNKGQQDKNKQLNIVEGIMSMFGTIFEEEGTVKHIAIDYKFIKASGIQEAIAMFGKNVKLTDDGQVEVAIVEDIENIQDDFTLINTGLKVNGASIYRIKNSDLLIYGAKDQQSIKIVQTLNGTEQLKNSLLEMMRALGEQADDIETQGIVVKQGEGIEVTQGIIEIGEMELEGKTAQEIAAFVTSSLEISRATGIMYGRKTIIGLEDLGTEDVSKLRTAIENGRARKVITKNQYDKLKLDEIYISQLREKGIELFVDNSNNELSEQEINEIRKNGIAGLIVKEGKNSYTYDFYSLDRTSLVEVDSEMLQNKTLEEIILSADSPILIGINLLKEQLKQKNINVVQREFGALLGKIKITLNIGTLSLYDVESMGYGVNFDKIPVLNEEQIDALFVEVDGKKQIADKDSLIEVIGAETAFAVILQTIKDETVEKKFREVIVDRILAKRKLLERANVMEGTELKNKSAEKTIGEMLRRQIEQRYADTTPNMDGVDTKNAHDNLMNDIESLKRLDELKTDEDTQDQQALVNRIIELILYDSERIKKGQIENVESGNLPKDYRAMLAAA